MKITVDTELDSLEDALAAVRAMYRSEEYVPPSVHRPLRYPSVGGRLRAARMDARLTAREVADRCRALGLPWLTRGIIAKIECGSRKRITLEEVVALSRAVQIPPYKLYLSSHE